MCPLTPEDKEDFSRFLFKGVDQSHLQGDSCYCTVLGPLSEVLRVGPWGLLLNCIICMSYKVLSDPHHATFSASVTFPVIKLQPLWIYSVPKTVSLSPVQGSCTWCSFLGEHSSSWSSHGTFLSFRFLLKFHLHRRCFLTNYLKLSPYPSITLSSIFLPNAYHYL